MENPRLGLWICDCAGRLEERLDIAAIEEAGRRMPDVVSVVRMGLLCSEAEMASIADKVLVDFKEDVSLFDTLLEDFTKSVSELDHRADLIEQRTTEAANGQEKLQAARKRAQQEVRILYQGKPVPESTREFL